MRFKAALSVLLLISLAVAACSNDVGTTTSAAAATTQAPVTTQAPATTAGQGTCAAARLSTPGAQQGLPEPVTEMRDAIVAAAMECDRQRIAELASSGPGEFIFAGGEILFFVGEEGSPSFEDVIPFLGSMDEDGIDLLAEAVTLLDLPFGFVADPEPWGLLDDPAMAPLYVWPAAGADTDLHLDAYLGITENGDWVFQYFTDL